jgi:hypothetical protein
VPGSGILRQVRVWLLTEPGRSALALAPLVAVFAVTEWLIAAGRSSFAGPLDFIGVVTVSILAGMFPVLLLLASRRKGEYVPGLVFRVLGYPPVAAAIYLVFLANLLAHGLILWQDPLERACALAVALVVVVVTVLMIRHGAFRRRTVVELRSSPGKADALFSVVASGRPLAAQVALDYGGSQRTIHAAAGSVPDMSELRSLTFELPRHEAAELEVWAHCITGPGTSEPMAGTVEVRHGEEVRQFELQSTGARVFAAVPDGGCSVTFTLPMPADREPALPGRRRRMP